MGQREAEKKLDAWTELLLDTGKRNNLINFKDTKKWTVEVAYPRSDEFFEEIKKYRTASFEIFDPNLPEDEDEDEDEDEEDELEESEDFSEPESDQVEVSKDLSVAEQNQADTPKDSSEVEQNRTKLPASYESSETHGTSDKTSDSGQDESTEQEEFDALSKKDAFIVKYSEKLKPSQVLIYHETVNSFAALTSIDKKNREYMEETGINVMYLAFGFIHWSENSSSNHTYRAPVLLVPIQLEQLKQKSKQEFAAKTWAINKMEDDITVNKTFSYKMEAEYGFGLPEYDDEEGLADYLHKVERLVRNLHWTVTEECKIGIFSFTKNSMYRDLKDNADAILANENILRLMNEPIDEEKHDSDSDVHPVTEPLIELHNVVDADSSQIEAIKMAKSGESFVLQGPPGTGKSQTITNIIAECLSDGKKVLFVSEKLAALNVVYDKLKQAGLAEFCLQLHSYKANKKDVVDDICNTLKMGRSAVPSKVDAEIASKESAMRQLNDYANELHKPCPLGKSLYQVYESYATFRSAPDVEHLIERLDSKNEGYLAEAVDLLKQYVNYTSSIGYDYRKNPWYGYVHQDTSYQTKIEVKNDFSAVLKSLEALVPVQKEISDRYGVQCASMTDARVWNEFLGFAATSKLVTPLLLNREHFDTIDSVLHDLQALSADILASRSVLDEAFDADIYELDGADCYKKLVERFGSWSSRLFNDEYKQLIRRLRLCKKDKKKPSYDTAVTLTKELASYQRNIAQFSETEAPVKAFLGEAYQGVETEWEYVTEQMSALERIFHTDIAFGQLTDYDDFSVEERKAFADFHQRLESVFEDCGTDVFARTAGYFDEKILNVPLDSCTRVSEKLRGCLNDIDKLGNWCHFRSLLSKLDDKQLVSYIHAAIGQNVERDHIVGAFQKQFYNQWIHSIVSASPVLSSFDRAAQDEAVRRFSEKDVEQFEINKAKIRAELSSKRPSLDLAVPGSPLSTLRRESMKRNKRKSIHDLFSEEGMGEIVQQVKPCFLMSPLSVSTFLEWDAIHFDVVVFDEASQIFPQDAIGAISRADQLIVVGDSKQMPPSNFFNSSNEVEDEDEDTGDVTDFESILDICSASMKSLWLRWHYRSRSEQLIAFSNKNFYDGDLVTFPSSKVDAPGIGVDYYHVDGVYKSQTNRKEAERVVDLIYRHIEEYPDRSLGVVAFSIKQQELIDRLLAKKRRDTPGKEFFFKDDGDEPFFVKNLETVQGDERDTIIFSVAYGRDSQGRLIHNFGPLNRAGGERRLNVAVTRAKYNIQLVSSMHYTDIDLKRTRSEGARLLREYLDYAENGTIALERTISVNQDDQFDSEFELDVCDFLRSKGYCVDTQVGCSGFRIDLGLKLPDSSDYVLAIECDGATYHSSKNARDRDRLRQEILERMGWKFYRIWSTDWFQNKSVAQEHLLEAVAEAVANPAKVTERPTVEYSTETFEEPAAEDHFEFPTYEKADVQKILDQYGLDFMGIVKAMLEIESPISEELLLKGIVGYFGRQKVTSPVRKEYERKIRVCDTYGVTRRNGFLYLDGKDVQFRRQDGVGNDVKRNIDDIAPEELAAGMLEVLKRNVSIDKCELYRYLANLCGVTRVTGSVNKAMDTAVDVLVRQERAIVDGERISIK